jgi:hypothetical protein
MYFANNDNTVNLPTPSLLVSRQDNAAHIASMIVVDPSKGIRR